MARLDAINSATPVASAAQLQSRLAAAQRAAAQAQSEVSALRQELRVAERKSDQKEADVQTLTRQAQTPTAPATRGQGRTAGDASAASTQNLLSQAHRAQAQQLEAMAYSRYGTQLPWATAATSPPQLSVRV